MSRSECRSPEYGGAQSAGGGLRGRGLRLLVAGLLPVPDVLPKRPNVTQLASRDSLFFLWTLGTIKMKSYGTIKLGRDTDQEIHCDIIRIYPVAGNEWACDLIIKRPFSNSVTIYGAEKSDTLKNAMNFVAGLSIH